MKCTANTNHSKPRYVLDATETFPTAQEDYASAATEECGNPEHAGKSSVSAAKRSNHTTPEKCAVPATTHTAEH